jgi:hypothetical protein
MILGTTLLGPGLGTLRLSFRTQPIGRKGKGGKSFERLTFFIEKGKFHPVPLPQGVYFLLQREEKIFF